MPYESVTEPEEKHNKFLMFMDWLKAKSFAPGFFSRVWKEANKKKTHGITRKKGESAVQKQLFMQTCHRQARSSLSLENGRGDAVNVSNNVIERANKNGNFRTQEKTLEQYT